MVVDFVFGRYCFRILNVVQNENSLTGNGLRIKCCLTSEKRRVGRFATLAYSAVVAETILEAQTSFVPRNMTVVEEF